MIRGCRICLRAGHYAPTCPWRERLVAAGGFEGTLSSAFAAARQAEVDRLVAERDALRATNAALRNIHARAAALQAAAA